MLVSPALCALVVLGLQDPKEQQAKPVDASAPKTLSDQEARTAVAAFKKATKAKGVKLTDRVAAVQALGAGSHRMLVKPLAATVQRDPSVTVAKTAAQSLGRQPEKQARPAILRLLDDSKVKKKPAVMAVLIESLPRVGYRASDWKRVGRLFERQFGEKYTPLQQAILKLVIATKEKQSWRLLIEHIDEPIPADVDGASNPPAEYWEGRWKAWRVWRQDVKDALFAITGQRFSSRKEARLWIRENGARAGLR